MNEPRGTRLFAPFEWMLSLRYLRARRQEGFISVNAAFSFLGIMLGVATLIIVMAVMNGFRKELLDKILGPDGPPPDPAAGAAADRLGPGGGPAFQGSGGHPRRADRRGAGAGVLALQRLRGARARRARRRPGQASLGRQQYPAGHTRRVRRRPGGGDRKAARRSALAAGGR